MKETSGVLPTAGLPAPGREATPDGGAAQLSRRQLESQLVRQHLGLAGGLASRYFGRGLEHDDLRQVAMLALVEAARRFDPSRGPTFAGYASVCILGELKRHFRDRTWVVRPPRGIQELYLQVKRAQEQLFHDLGTSPTVLQVAQRVGAGEEEVLEALEAGANYWPTSLDAPTGDGRTLDPPSDEDFAEALVTHQTLQRFLQMLDGRERAIVRGYYFEGRTQASIADELGLSQMQVSRLLARAVAKLRLWLRER